MGRFLAAALGVVVMAALVGCTPESSATPTPTAAVTFASVVDGDTIETSEGRVRLIGIDAPESGACGYQEASALVSSLLTAGDPVDLGLPDGQNDTDQYGRLIRYVDTAASVDVGLSLLEAGLAVARYDSTDGYPAHPRESAYRAAQTATSGADGSVVTVDCKAAADAAEQERIAAEQRAAEDAATPVVDEWWRQYGSCSQLKKNANGHPVGPFNVDNPDEAALYDWFQNGTGHRGDGDGDGLACE
ncbi:thermonuclease family protein [Microbacterium sp. NPDC055357]